MAIVNIPGHYCHAHAHLQADKDRRHAEYLTKHANEAWAEYKTRNHYSAITATPKWRAISSAHRAKHPLCEWCGEKGTTVDHIKPHRGNEDLAFDPDNLQTLCRTCHNKKSARDRMELR